MKRKIKGYVDADWGSCSIDRRSYTGYAFVFNGAAITWKSQKQRTVALSSTEAEYIALTESAKEAIHYEGLMRELRLHDLCNINVSCDNLEAKHLAENSYFHSRTKHIDIRHHFTRDAIKVKNLSLNYISTNEMAADVLTKSIFLYGLDDLTLTQTSVTRCRYD